MNQNLKAVIFNVPKTEQVRYDESGNEQKVFDYPERLLCENGETNCPDYTPIERAIVAEVYRDDLHTLHYAHGLPVVEGKVTVPVIDERIAPYFAEYLAAHPECGVYEEEEAWTGPTS